MSDQTVYVGTYIKLILKPMNEPKTVRSCPNHHDVSEVDDWNYCPVCGERIVTKTYNDIMYPSKDDIFNNSNVESDDMQSIDLIELNGDEMILISNIVDDKTHSYIDFEMGDGEYKLHKNTRVAFMNMFNDQIQCIKESDLVYGSKIMSGIIVYWK